MSSQKDLGGHYPTREPLLAGVEVPNEFMVHTHSEELRHPCQGVEKGLVKTEQHDLVLRSAHHSELLSL